jgi:hypothetical protein
MARPPGARPVRRGRPNDLAGKGEAYGEARTWARQCRSSRDHASFNHWSRVAVEIARRTGYVVGEKAADRYLQARERLTFAPARAGSWSGG